jgi:hypothetical protein
MMTKGEVQHLWETMVQALQWYLARGSMGSWVLNVIHQEDNEYSVQCIEIVDILTGTVAMRMRSEEEYEAGHDQDSKIFPNQAQRV